MSQSWNVPAPNPALHHTTQTLRICLFPFPYIPDIPPHRKHEAGVYLSGGLFAIGWWIFINALVQCHLGKQAIGVEWAPGLALTFGMMIVNSIDQSHLIGDWYGQDEQTWKVRLAFFVGVAIMVGGFAGSVILYAIKYSNPELNPLPGVSVILQCGCIVLSSVCLWIAQNSEGEYHIALNNM